MKPEDNNITETESIKSNVPSQPIKQGNKSSLIVILIVLLLSISVIALTWYLMSTSTSKKLQEKDSKISELNNKIDDLNKEVSKLKENQTTNTTTSGTDQTSILNNIKSLYKDRAGGGQTESEKKYFTDDFYTNLLSGQFAADPILCAQNVVEYDKLVFNNPTITGTNATISVKTQYGTTINIKLVKQNNNWLVSSVTCPAQ